MQVLFSRTTTCGSSFPVVSTETVLNSSRVDDWGVFYASPDNQVVFIRTTDGKIYRSKNEGRTWDLVTVNSRMPHVEDPQTYVLYIFMTKIENRNRKLVFLGNQRGQLWTTNDYGDTFTYYESPNVPVGIRWIYVSPLFQSKLLARRAQELWYSNNLGAHWSKIFSSILSYNVQWSPFPEDPPDRIYADVYDPNKVTGNEWDQFLVRTDDYFQSYKVLCLHVVAWTVVQPNKILVVQLTEDQQFSLLISEDRGEHFRRAIFPVEGTEEATERGYYIYDTSEDSVIVYVNRNPHGYFQWGDVYKSNAYDDNFVRSLRFQRFPDLTRYQGLPGIYIANVYNASDPQRGPKLNDDIETIITFNKGGLWEPLDPPQYDADGKPTNCKLENGCSLHLHGWASAMFTWFYSVPNAVGLMFATGNLGTELSNRPDEINSYFSRDAGVTWMEIRKGSWVPEFGDHGGVIVLADTQRRTNTFIYTLDEGKTFTTCPFSADLAQVTNIRVSPAWDSRRFILYGTRNTSAILVQLDFTNAFPRGNCDPAQDYEEWSPTDEHGNCLLGERVTFRRRKRESQCFNGEQFERIVRRENCSCTYTDYECDFCFVLDPVMKRCVFTCYDDPDQFRKLPPPPPNCTKRSQYYEVPFGYRKVEDDVCDERKAGSIARPKGLVPCSAPTPTNIPDYTPTHIVHSNILLTVTIIFVVIGLTVLILFLLYKKNRRFNNCIRYTFNVETEGSIQYSRVRRVTDNTFEEEQSLAPSSQL
jgi:hypothetical protein